MFIPNPHTMTVEGVDLTVDYDTEVKPFLGRRLVSSCKKSKVNGNRLLCADGHTRGCARPGKAADRSSLSEVHFAVKRQLGSTVDAVSSYL